MYSEQSPNTLNISIIYADCKVALKHILSVILKDWLKLSPPIKILLMFTRFIKIKLNKCINLLGVLNEIYYTYNF